MQIVKGYFISTIDPIVSIITPAFRSEAFIEDTYNSILQQSVGNWEWNIHDDASPDRTPTIIRDLAARDHRIVFSIGTRNLGAAQARNKCIDSARGKYLAFLDSDDIWLPQKLERQIEYMQMGCDFSFTSYKIVDEQGCPLGKMVDTHDISTVGYEDMLRKRATLGCSTVMISRALVGEKRMPDIRTGQDYSFWLSILKDGHRAHRMDECLTEYRLVAGSLSRNKYKKAIRQWTIYREVEGIDRFKSAVCFMHYAKNAIFRR